MNPHLLLSALRARFRVLLFVLGTTVLVTLLVSLLLPKTYIATTAIVVDDGKGEQSLIKPPSLDYRERTNYMQTQVDIITSQKVAGKVARLLKLSEDPKVREDFMDATDGEGSIDDWIAAALLKKLSVDTTQSSVITISFAADDRDFAARVANTFADAYMETALQLRVEPSRQTAIWFDEQMARLRTTLEQAQARLAAYQKEKGLVDERFDVESLALTDLATEVVKAQARRAGTGLPEPGSAAISQGIRSELMRAESKLQELSSRLGTNHPSYRRQLAETQRLRGSLQADGGHALGPTPYNKRRVAELRSALEAQQAKVLELSQHRHQLGLLTRDVDVAQKAYETAMQHSLEKRVESQANLTNINLLYAAIAPFKATRPRITLNLAISLVVGSLLGLCIIYLMEMFDHRVRSRIDLRNEFQVPVLAELTTWQPTPVRLLGRPENLPVLPNPS